MLSDPKSLIAAVGRPRRTEQHPAVPLLLRGAPLAAVAWLLGGCSLRGAPSYSLFGAFFPAWLLCAGIGIAGSIALRFLIIAVGLEEAIPFRLLVYVACAAGLASSIWLLLFTAG
jgi:hypothetical protein